MKKIIAYLLSASCLSFTVKTAVKTVAITGGVTIANESKSQFGFYYTPSDSIWHNQGGWSLIDLYFQKDSTARSYSSLFRFTSKIVEARCLSVEFANASHDTIACLNPQGRFYKRSVSSLNIPAAQVKSDWNSVSGLNEILNKPTVPAALNGTGFVKATGTSISYDNSTYLTTEVDGSTSNEIQTLSGTGTPTLTLGSGGTWVMPAVVSNTVSRSLNSSFTISATQDYEVDYSVYCQVSSALTGTNTADSYLEVSTTSGGTYTVLANGGVMASGVLSTNGATSVLSGFIPAGYWVKIRTAAAGSNSGSALFIYRYGRENNH
jgi:hypothetical protein